MHIELTPAAMAAFERALAEEDMLDAPCVRIRLFSGCGT